MDKAIFYESKTGLLHPHGGLYKNVTEEDIIECIEKLPNICQYDVCSGSIVTSEVIKKLFRKFPEANLVDWDSTGAPSEEDMLKKIADELNVEHENQYDYELILSNKHSKEPSQDSWSVLKKYIV